MVLSGPLAVRVSVAFKTPMGACVAPKGAHGREQKRWNRRRFRSMQISPSIAMTSGDAPRPVCLAICNEAAPGRIAPLARDGGIRRNAPRHVCARGRPLRNEKSRCLPGLSLARSSKGSQSLGPQTRVTRLAYRIWSNRNVSVAATQRSGLARSSSKHPIATKPRPRGRPRGRPSLDAP
jgi:hypothetical protein